MATNPVEHINGQIKRKSSCVTNGVPCAKRICTQHRPQSLWEQTLSDFNDLTQTTAELLSAEVVPPQHDIDFGSPAPAHANCD